MEAVNKSGYKQTELGLIPEDWLICEFQDVMTGFSSGQTPYREIKKYYTGEIPWITSGELNYNVITDTYEKITSEAVRKTNLKTIPKGTFLFAITGLEAEGTRGSCAITGIDATTNQSCMALYPIKGKLTTGYLFHFYVKNGDLLAFKYCQGTKQQSYTAAIAKKLPIVLPTDVKEQTAIASALSDMDALIAQTEKLIEKKKAIKQGVMQELLTGKKRLKGFENSKGYKQTEVGVIPEDWEVKKLGEIGKFKNGINKSAEDFGFGNPFVNLMDVFGKVKIDSQTELGLINSNVFEKKTYNLRKGDVLLIRSSVKPSGVGLSIVIEEDLSDTVYSGFLIRFRDNGALDEGFKKYCFHSETFRNDLISNSTISANTNINQESLKNLFLAYPPNKSEQTAIASVLSDIDEEFIGFETKLQKLKLQKQGMMQALLTGKIRLV